MSQPYEENLQGETVQRLAPGRRHEMICARLHHLVRASVADFAATRLCSWREAITLSPDTVLRPDLALVTVATGKLWLAAEIVNSDDHRVDTVWKKEIYEAMKLPRLWMIDPRYDNVEVYHGTPYGLTLKGILAGSELLTETLLPEFEISVRDLFATPAVIAAATDGQTAHSPQLSGSEEEELILEFLRRNPQSGFSRLEIARKAVRRTVYEENPRWADAPLSALVDKKLVLQDQGGAFRLNRTGGR